jgi:hypothetical protein
MVPCGYEMAKSGRGSAPARNSKEYIALLADIEADNPKGDLYLITDNLSSHTSLETRTWLEAQPRLHHVFIPTGACWLNLRGEAGGASSDTRRLPGSALPTPRRSTRRGESPPNSSIAALTPGSLDGRPRRHAGGGASFVIVFNERSSSATFLKRW